MSEAELVQVKKGFVWRRDFRGADPDVAAARFAGVAATSVASDAGLRK
jgi:hypothetical protein